MTDWDVVLDRFEASLDWYEAQLDGSVDEDNPWGAPPVVDEALPARAQARANALLARARALESAVAARLRADAPTAGGSRRRTAPYSGDETASTFATDL